MKYNVIIADDFEHDIELATLELKRSGKFRVIHKARDGEEVLQYLEGRPPFSDRDIFPLPQLLLLDLKMLKVNGLHVLGWIKEHKFPIISFVLTGFEVQHYVAMARALGATAIFFKPLAREDVQQMIVLAERMVAARVGMDADGILS